MRILGIDPGLRTTGFGVIDVHGSALAYVASGTISTLKMVQTDLPSRLKLLFDGVREVAQLYQADCACVEIVWCGARNGRARTSGVRRSSRPATE